VGIKNRQMEDKRDNEMDDNMRKIIENQYKNLFPINKCILGYIIGMLIMMIILVMTNTAVDGVIKFFV
jgi:hypothetical protein